jgi:small subunit ribosomal protein S1
MQKTDHPQKKHIEFDMTQFGADDHEAMVQMYEETLKNFKVGSIVPGKVLEVRHNEVLVDIGYKSEGIIPGIEFRKLSEVAVGDPLDVLLEAIEDEDGIVVLSKQKAEEKIRWENVVNTCEQGSVIEGVIQSRVKGGFIVDMGGVDAFLPGSQVDVAPVRDIERLMGNTFEFKIVKINPDRRNIVLSRRELIEEQLRAKKKVLLAEISIGQLRKGRVTNITDFGAFVDLDGMHGLLHITDMSWGRINHPSEVVKIGEDLEVVILDIDLEKERVSLGLKQKTANPWDSIEAKYAVGSRVKGRVVNLVPYGAFVELEEGVEGLVHVSEISWTRRVVRAADVLSVEEIVDVVVLDVNKDKQKIALGIRQTEENPWEKVADRYPVGTRVKGCVRNFTSYGAFVELEEGIDGMIHVSDMSWTRKITHPSEVMTKGESVEAIVLEVDAASRRISLGLKQAQDDPWTVISGRYEVGQLVKGKVTKLTSFGAFLQLEEDVEGLVHISQITDDYVEKVGDVLVEGQEVEARVVRVDPAERRIGLSIKAAEMPEEDYIRQLEEESNGPKPGEDMVDLAGAFDEAFGGSQEVWHPGEAGDEKDSGSDKDPSSK